MGNFTKALIINLCIIPCFSFAQKSIMDDITIKGDIRFGGNYWAFVGIHGTENVALYTDFTALHKSGFGIRYMAYDDFSKEEKGRVRFFDAAYTHTFENLSIYGAFEYISFDNWHDGERIRPYATINYQLKQWNIGTGAIYNYCPHLDKKNEIMFYTKVGRPLLKELDLNLTVWYDNLYKDNFYGDVCARLQLPKKFYLKCDVLYRDRKVTPFISIGWQFSTKE